MQALKEFVYSNNVETTKTLFYESWLIHLQVRARLVKMGALSSMNIFLRQEIDRMQRVISLVRTTLTDLKLAIEGTIIMS